MTIRPASKTYNIPVPPKSPEPPPIVYESDNFSLGLITDANTKNIPPNAFTKVKNVTYVKNQILRRNGLSSYSIAKPDSLRILALFTFFQSTYGVQFLRFTKSSVYRAGSSGWTAFTGPALVGGDKDPYSFTVADNRGFFSNNGANVIQELFPATASYANLGNAPKYKYIASAFNRLVGANRRDITDVPYEIGWSGDLNYAQWNPVTDISAGSTPLVTSPSDLSDDITGVFNLESVLCIPRQRSIWLGTNLPSATNPFNFTLAVPRIGCDIPQTVALAENGIFFYNFQTSAAYFYAPGSQPEEFSQQVKRALKADIKTTQNVFAAYNYDTKTYSIFLWDDNASLVKAYSYNVDDKNWVYDEFQNVSMVNDSEFSSSSITIDELTGTIDTLAGTIDSLGGLPASAVRFFGLNDGTLAIQPVFPADSNLVGNIIPTDLGSIFATSFESKCFAKPGVEGVFKKLQIEYTPYTTGNLAVQYSIDNGVTWNQWKTIVVNSNMLFHSQTATVKRPRRGRQFTWRFGLSGGCMFSLDGFRLEEDISGSLVTTTK